MRTYFIAQSFNLKVTETRKHDLSKDLSMWDHTDSFRHLKKKNNCQSSPNEKQKKKKRKRHKTDEQNAC